MYLEQLTYLISAIESKSISAAAESLFITQSALSQAISNLEEELGVKLLIRTNRGVTATVFGEIIYSDAKEIIKVVKGYKEKWRAMLDDTSCTSNIRIVAYPSANSILVDNIIPELCNMYPNMDFSVFEEPPSKNEIEIMKRYDATIRIGSWVKPEFEAVREEIERNGYAVDVLCENDPLQLLVSSKSPYAKYESLNESDLKKMSVAFYATEKAPVYLKYFDDAKCFKLQQHGSIMRFVANNGAVAVFPKNIVKSDPYVKEHKIVSIPIKIDSREFPPITSYIVHRTKDKLTEDEKRVIWVINHYFKYSTDEL